MEENGKIKQMSLYDPKSWNKEVFRMKVNINIQVTPFGQVSFEIGKPTPALEQEKISEGERQILYIEPLTSGIQHFEIEYQESKNYIVPLTTG